MPASKLQPALLGGLFIGVLSALPIISAGNCFCCMWVIGGGVLAAYLLQQNQATPISSSDGAVTGLLAGLIGAVVSLVINIPIEPDLRARCRPRGWSGSSSSAGDVPPELRSVIESMQQIRQGSRSSALLMGFVFMVFAGVIFGSLGGLLGALFFKKDGPPPPTPPIPQNPFGGTPFNPPPLGRRRLRRRRRGSAPRCARRGRSAFGSRRARSLSARRGGRSRLARRFARGALALRSPRQSLAIFSRADTLRRLSNHPK